MKRIYEVTVMVREKRTFTVEAASQDDAETMALEGDAGEPKVDVLDEFVHDCEDVTEDYRPEPERLPQPRIMAALKESLS